MTLYPTGEFQLSPTPDFPRHLISLTRPSPPPRNFFRRMSTRVLSQPDRDTYKAVKMPRGEYLRHFRHDAQGHYAGTEPEREWAEEEINEKYGQYQEMPLRAVLGRPGAAAGVPMFGW